MTELEIGRRIYQEGILADGSPLQGLRYGSESVTGAEAACIACHRRSGLGAVEGDIQVSPITGKFLFGGRGLAVVNMDPRVGKRFNRHHQPYTDAALAEAVRTGKNAAGHDMIPMMPRYPLGDGDLKALTAYLNQLSARWSPGADENDVHLATVITPEVPEWRRKALQNVIETIVQQKNNTTRLKNDPRGRRHMVSAAEFVLGTERKWQWEIWNLQGPAETWQDQMKAFYAKQPVFALVSNLSEGNVEPVHAFCDRESIPCWFSMADAPPPQESFYSIYYSRGVVLEAEVLAHYLTGRKTGRPSRIVQIYRPGAVGEAASAALARALQKTGVTTLARPLVESGANALRKALQGLGGNDAVLLWLRRDDLAELKAISPVPAQIFLSGQLAGAEGAPIPPKWKSKARMIYPYELPAEREGALMPFHLWAQRFQQPIVDEPLQSQAYFAMTYLGDTLSEMLDNLHRDYLMERGETMLSRRETMKSNEWAMQRGIRGMPHAEFGSNESTTIYPHMGLGAGQRFASKGAYVVRFDPAGKPVADSDWIVP